MQYKTAFLGVTAGEFDDTKWHTKLFFFFHYLQRKYNIQSVIIYTTIGNKEK